MHIFLVFLVVLVLTSTTVAAVPTGVATHHRRTLHQPFFPQDAPILPPAHSPAPATAPTAPPPSPPSLPPAPPSPPLNVPFLSSPTTSPPGDDQPFFHTFPSPPPPPTTASASSSASSTASFPANISSLSLPASPKPKPASSKLVPVVVTIAIAAIIVLFVILVLKIQKRKRNYDDSQSFSDEKPPINDGLFGTAVKSTGNGNNSYNRIPKLNRPSQTSSEFLYLGTLVNSHGGTGIGKGNGIDGGEDSNLQKIASPELRPLPPLTGGSHSGLQNGGYETSELESRDEEFYSPRASEGGIPGGVTAAIGGRGSGGLGSSSSYTSSSSGSPARSISLSISPPASLSPRNSRLKSPDLVAIHTAPPPSRPAPPPPPPQRHPVVIPSPDVGLSKDSLESSPRFSNSSNELNFPPAKIPPPPPPPMKLPDVTPPAPAPAPANRLNPPVLIKPSWSVPVPVTATVNTHQAHIPPIEMSPENQENLETTTLKPKLKPLHWDKVRASSDREMVWDHLKSSSFKLNEEMIETLFIVKPPNPSNSNEKSSVKRSILRTHIDHENQVLDPKRSQNISIALRALNVTAEDICDALLEGNVDALGTELLESLLKMVPTKEEERKLKDYQDDSPYKLGPAEKFLKTVLDVPFAFKRICAMLYVSSFSSEVEYLNRSFQTLDAACEELRTNRMFLKLLEAVLKTGNRMNVGTNRGDAQAFKLDTLLKLIDVKSADGKTTLLHFVVQEITRTEGARLTNPTTNPSTNQATKPANGLQTISNLCTELSNVKKAAAMDYEVLKGDVIRLSNGIVNALDVVKLLEGTKFSDSMNGFLTIAEQEVIKIQDQERDTLCLVKEITEYFHGNSAKEEAHPLRIFMVVRDFLTVLGMVCKEVKASNDRMSTVHSGQKFQVPINPNPGFPTPGFDGLQGRRQQLYSSSDDESSCSL